MPNLYPVWDAPETIEQAQAETVSYGRSFYFDFEKGDFIVDGAGRLVGTEGYESWSQWCQKTLMTQRGAYLAYSDDYGTDLDQIRIFNDRGAKESQIKRVFTEALMADPRTEGVRGFSFLHEGDQTQVNLTVYPRSGLPVNLEVRVND